MMCLHGVLCSISFVLDMQHDHFQKKNAGGRGESAVKIYTTMLPHMSYPLI